MSKRTKDLLKINPWPGILERRIDARLKADAIRDAEHRVAEAALKAVPYIDQRWVRLAFGSQAEAMEYALALDDLRRLKGEG